MPQKDRCFIVVSKRNYDQLRKLGVATDSFDAIITKLLKQTKPQDTGQLKRHREVVKPLE